MMTTMYGAKIKSILVIGFLIWISASATAGAASQEASIIVHFDSAQAYLSTSEKAKLRKFFQKYEIGPSARVFIVGYTDAAGSKDHNYKLSRKRAKAIRREIISAFGLDGTVVMAMGKGEESPLGDNDKASGMAANRRAEIYLVNTEARKSSTKFGSGDLSVPPKDIQALIQEAQALTKQHRIGEAIQRLKKARGLGGDQYSDWHAAYGIAGFYANAPQAQIHAHLATAIKTDPYNFLARDYLGRITARHKVARGEVNKDMGLTSDTAIEVASVAQQYEYLRLFNVEPLVHHEMDGRPVDRWACVSREGVPVVYYFNHSRVYDWAFTKRSAKRTEKASPKKNSFMLYDKGTNPASKLDKPSSSPTSEVPAKVWESKLFN